MQEMCRSNPLEAVPVSFFTDWFLAADLAPSPILPALRLLTAHNLVATVEVDLELKLA